MYENWVIDAGLSRPTENAFCFIPVEGDLSGNCTFVTGMNILSIECPGTLVGIIHPEGQEAVNKWCEEYKEELEQFHKGK